MENKGSYLQEPTIGLYPEPYESSSHWYLTTHTSPDSITTQKTTIDIFIAMRTSNLIKKKLGGQHYDES
jgi:hypothetical protein